MKFLKNNYSYKTALHIAIEQGNSKIVTFLLQSEDIDVNIKSVFLLLFFSHIILNCLF